MRKHFQRGLVLMSLAALGLHGQQLFIAQNQQPDFPGDRGPGNGPMRRGGPPRRPMDGPFRGGPPGRWWSDSAIAQRLELNEGQQKRMEDIFQNSRLKLIDLSAALRKEEALLDNLLQAERLEDSKVFAQIDRIAEARSELEKANGRMLYGFRGVLTQTQWRQLHAGEGFRERR